MLYYHTVGVNNASPHNYYSKWWMWPLALMPVWYGTHNGPVGGDTRGYVFNQVNPFLAWSMIPAVADGRLALAAAVPPALADGGGDPDRLLRQWLVWAASPRGAFAYHFLPMVPFGVVGIAALLEYGWRNRTVTVGRSVLKWAPVAVFAGRRRDPARRLPRLEVPADQRRADTGRLPRWGNYGIPVVLFGLVALAMAYGVVRTPRTLSLRTGAVTYVVLAVLVFAFLFPILAATQLTQSGLDLRTWFPGWTVR